MKANDYVKNVLITEARDLKPLQERFSQPRNIRLLHGAIGLASELAEIRQMLIAEDIDEVNLLEEMGDVSWYVGIMVDELKLDAQKVFGTHHVTRNSRGDTCLILENAVDMMTIDIGQTIDLLKKSLIYGKELDVSSLEEILTSICSRVEVCLNQFVMTGAGARARNIEKLKARYGDKFTEAAALERDLTLERHILEKK